jgi:diacylglycerol kinase family enzyme
MRDPGGRVKIDVIVNAASGTGSRFEIQQSLTAAFTASGAETRVLLAADGAALVMQAQRAAQGDASTIVAAGGDGTINAVAATLVGSDRVLGVLPFGTMNHFAKDLGIPLDLDGAVATITAGHAVRVDVGDVNGHIFVNNASLGLYPRVIHERERQQRLGWGKWPAYLWAILAVLRRNPFLDIRLRVDGEELVGRTPFVFIGNNRYDMAQLTVGRRARLDRGELSLYTTSRSGRLGLVRLAFRALRGGLRQERDFLAVTTTAVSITSRRKHLRVALDGEVLLMRPPLQYRTRPGALCVLAPANHEPR